LPSYLIWEDFRNGTLPTLASLFMVMGKVEYELHHISTCVNYGDYSYCQKLGKIKLSSAEPN